MRVCEEELATPLSLHRGVIGHGLGLGRNGCIGTGWHRKGSASHRFLLDDERRRHKGLAGSVEWSLTALR